MEATTRVRFQLRLIAAIYHRESARREPEQMRALVQRSLALLDELEPELAIDGDLRHLYEALREELEAHR